MVYTTTAELLPPPKTGAEAMFREIEAIRSGKRLSGGKNSDGCTVMSGQTEPCCEFHAHPEKRDQWVDIVRR